jgi:hypothetical protein
LNYPGIKCDRNALVINSVPYRFTSIPGANHLWCNKSCRQVYLFNRAQNGDKVPAQSKILTPAKAAEIIVKAMESDKYQVYVGPDAKFLGIFNRISPKTAASFISKQMKKYGITSQ